MFKLIHKYKSSIIRFLYCLLLSVVNGYFFNYLNTKYFNYSSNENGLSEFSNPVKFFIIVVITPIIETLIFNLFPNQVLKKFGIKNNFLLVIIPSIIFSMFHLYHPIYGLMALIGGIIMNWYFLYSHSKTKIAFTLVALLHSSYNLYGYLFVN